MSEGPRSSPSPLEAPASSSVVNMVTFTRIISLLGFGLTAIANPVPAAVADPIPAVVSSVLSPVVSVVTGLGGIAGTVGGAVGSVPALVQAKCNAAYTSCTATISGEIENMLVDGGNWSKSPQRHRVSSRSVSRMVDGHSYGNVTLAGSTPAPVPWNITCNATANVCTGNVTASVTAMFANGKDIEGWIWSSPSGSCANGTCTGSLTTVGDPYYKA